MGQGISFFDGCDAPEISDTNTQPDSPRVSSGGPVMSPEGLEEGSSFGITTSGGEASGLSNSQWDSPADR